MAKSVQMARCMWRCYVQGPVIETPYGAGFRIYEPLRYWVMRYLRRHAHRHGRSGGGL